MSMQLEKALSIIQDKQLERFLSLVVGGYILGLGFYFVWCFFFYYERLDRGNFLLAFVVGVIVITSVYFIFYLLILHIKSLQKVWTSFFLVSLISLLVLFFIPSVNSEIFYKFHDIKLNLNQDKPIKFTDKNESERKILAANKKEIEKQLEDVKKAHTGQKRMELIKFKLNNSHGIDDVANTSITELQAKLEFVRRENDKLRKELNETIRNLRFEDDIVLALRPKLKEERKPEEKIVENEKSNRDSSEIKINAKVDNTDLDSLGQEIIFKVQIISSDTLISINSPKLMGLKNVWVYKDAGLYKYTVGKEKDLKSAYLLQLELRRKGFVGAFVVAFKNRKRIPVRDARKLLN